MSRLSEWQNKRRNFRKKLLFSLTLGIVGTLLIGSFTYTLIRNPKQVMTNVVNEIGQGLSGNTQPVNILLIANNARDAANPLSLGSAGGQADILLVVHFDPSKHEVTLISVPRDTLIALPDWDIPIPKIKSVFTLGLEQSPEKGPELAMQAVSKITGLPIHDYIVTDFQGFVDAINAVGGIEVDVPARLYDPEHSGVDLQPGKQILNGEQALAYIRVRQNQAGNTFRVNDFQRQDAEMQVLEILKSKLLDSSKNPAQIQRLVEIWNKDIATNMNPSRLVGIGMEVAGAEVKKITLGSMSDSMNLADAPAPNFNKENYITGAYYDVLDPKEITEKLAPLGSSGADLGLPSMPEPSDVPVVVYGSQNIVDELEKKGFQVTYAGPMNNIDRVMIYYPSGHMPWGWVVARALGTANEFVAPLKADGTSLLVYAP
jgi:LCP family protein required for cell wall assembly